MKVGDGAVAAMETLERILSALGVDVDRRTFSRLEQLRDTLLEENQRANLTAITDPRDVEVRLLADSLALLPLIEAERLREGREAMRVIDIGTGAGFPGLPLAIANPAVEITLVDATRKKVDFIHGVIARLGLINAIAVHARSEDLARREEYRERFDIVTARAVASLPALVELCLPFLRVGGLALFTKGRAIEDEIASAGKALDVIGGELFDVHIPSGKELPNTAILCVRKIHPTPRKYPRSAGTPARNPL